MQPWIRIRQQLFRRLEAHVRQILGPESQGTSRYRQQYEKELRKGWKPSSREALIDEISKSSLVLIGDFHALHQSQRGQLRILKSIALKRPVVLAVEFFEAQHQAQLTRYLKGKWGERDFLKAIQWQKNWGFPWENYRPLLRWAEKRKCPVYGLNKRTESRSAATLGARDRFAAEKLREIREAHPDALIVVIFGDLHLAEEHLPKQIRREKRLATEKILTILQNPERLYFQLLERGLELTVDVVRLKKDRYCLLNVPPWVKWQNYLLFLERHLDQELEEGLDWTDEIANYLGVLAHDLDLTVSAEDLTVLTPSDEVFWDQLAEKFSDRDRRFLRDWIERGVSFYLPETSAGFLARTSVNHAAGLAMAYLHARVSGVKRSPLRMPEDFRRLIWCETMQYFGTKLINPKRKTDTLQDLKASLAAQLPQDSGKEALQLALTQKLGELWWLSGQRRRPTLFRPRRMASYQEAARILGGMLGEKLFAGYRMGQLSRANLVPLIQRPVDAESFDDFYFEVLEIIESLPEPFLSKTEKL